MLRFFTVCLLALFSYAQDTTQDDVKSYEDDEAYSVYSAVLALEKPGGEVLIADTTVPFHDCAEPRSDKPVDSAIKHYKHLNQTRWQLLRKFNLEQVYRLLSAEEIKNLHQADPQGGFFWSFPEGIEIRHFSAVGFNAQKTIAFLETDVQCGGLCGHGQPYVLVKRDGKWEEYQGKEPKIKKLKKLKDGSYKVAMQHFGFSFCGWSY